MIERFELDVICTERGGHPVRTLATLRREDHPVLLFVAGGTVRNPAWPGHTWRPLNYRRTAAGFTALSGDYTPGRIEHRPDGGTNFVVPGCPTCLRKETPLRDDKLTWYWDRTADTPELRGVLDVSLGVP